LGCQSSASQKLAVIIALSASLIAGCNNGGGPGGAAATTGKSTGSTGGSSFVPGGTGVTTPAPGNSSFITVTRVVLSNADPTSLIDLVGQNGEIGSQCPDGNTCHCEFNWTETSGVLRDSETTPVRIETNLMRCPFNVVTPDVKFFDVKIKILTANLGSNSTRVFLTSVNPSLDSSIGSNYLPAYRFMCRMMAVKKNVPDSGMYTGLFDPTYWDMSLPFTFYTTAFGRDYGAVAPTTGGAANSLLGWECPPIPNDPSDNPIYDYKVYSLDPIDLANIKNITGTPAIPNNTIYPVDDDVGAANCPTGNEPTCEKYLVNRHDFYLATFKSGTFKQPLCILHTVANLAGGALNCVLPPDTATSGPTTLQSPGIANTGAQGADIIGFAAMPDQNQRCPDPSLVKLPSGKKWAKLWQFRTSYDARSVKVVQNPGAIGTLFCTTRNNECAGMNTGSQPSVCVGAKITGSSSTRLGAEIGATLGGAITDPGFGNCDQNGLSGDGHANETLTGHTCNDTANSWICCQDVGDPNSGFAAGVQTPANYKPGGQWCNGALIGSHDASADGGLAEDVWLFGANGSSKPCIEADTDANGLLKLNAFPPPAPVGAAYAMTTTPLDSSSQADVLYVVTPESVNFEDMQDPQSSKIARFYTPWRAKPNGAAGDQQVYRLVSNTTNSADPTTRLSQFPVCIIQDSQKGVTTVTP
jgi:hypothetical protein